MNNTPFHLCKTCGNQYYKKPTMSKKDWEYSKFCSRKCVNVGRAPFNKGKKWADLIPNYVHPMQGKHHTPETIAKIKANRTPQILTEAQHKALEKGRTKEWTTEMRQRMSDVAKERKLGHGKGADSPAWKDGRTPLVRSFRACPRYAEWRETIMVRDNYTCLRCNAKGNLEVNHIVTVKDIFNTYDLQTMDDVYACDTLWDINNGETLCASCHRLIG
jgi:5-methylcytosine-specific restriction endonuclease McrA